jgi:hypothetical protein
MIEITFRGISQRKISNLDFANDFLRQAGYWWPKESRARPGPAAQ